MKECKLVRFCKDGLISEEYLIFKGDKGIVISETDCCHFVLSNEELQKQKEITVPMHYRDNIFHVEYKNVLFEDNTTDIELINADPELKYVIHYFGIKDRVYQNYKILQESLKEINFNYIDDLPEWQRIGE